MPRRGSPRRLGAALAALALVLVPAAAGCGSGEDDPAQPVAAPANLTPVKVGVLPIVDVAPLFLGKEKGFFAKRGIDLKTTIAEAGPLIVPGVVKGEFQFGFANMTSLMINQTKNVPIQVVASGVASTGQKGLDFGGVVVPVNSKIQTAADLNGKTIAVNAVGSIGDTTVRESVRAAGGDPKSLKFVAKPLPQMQAFMEAGGADAAWTVEPWLSLTKGTGGRVVAWNYVDLAPKLTVAAYFTNAKLVQENPDLVKRFVESMQESMRFADNHPDQIRDILQTYMTIDRVLTQAMTLPLWPADINRPSVERLAQRGVEDGLFGDKKPDLDKLLPAT
jgi:NitT/TauT family transport system substrate-binding protein